MSQTDRQTPERCLTLSAMDVASVTSGDSRRPRVLAVDGSCAKHLTVESYTVVMLLTFILITVSIPSPLTLSFQA